MPVRAVAAPGRKLDAEQPDCRTGPKRFAERVAVGRLRRDVQPPRIGARREARRAAQDRGPGAAGLVDRSGDEERQPRKKCPVLIGHEAADVAAGDQRHLFRHAGGPLRGTLAFVPGRFVALRDGHSGLLFHDPPVNWGVVSVGIISKHRETLLRRMKR